MKAIVLAAVLFAAPQTGQSTGQATRGSDASDQASAAPMVEGTWQVVYAEKAGHRIEGSTLQSVMIRGNTLSFTHDGQQRSVQLRFGPHQTVWADHASGQSGTEGTRSGQGGTTGRSDQGRQGGTGSDQDRRGTAGQGRTTQDGAGSGQRTAGSGQGPHRGVYIASQEYLCLCFEDGLSSGGRTGSGTGTGAGTGSSGTTTGSRGTGSTDGSDRTSGRRDTGTGTGTGASAAGGQGANFVLILRKGQAGREKGQ